MPTIKSWIDGRVLYDCGSCDLKTCLEAVVAQGADLQGADLRGADLRGANLQGANLQGAKYSIDIRLAKLEGAIGLKEFGIFEESFEE